MQKAGGGHKLLNFSLSTVETQANTGYLHLSLVPPKDGARQPAAVVCMLDVSGSMGSMGSEEQTESAGFAIIDLMKHAMKTIIQTLRPTDYMAIITFNDKAAMLFPLQLMTIAAKESAIKQLDTIDPDGGTNIWEALSVAVNLVAENAICESANTSLWLFTDGEPTKSPARGIVPSLVALMGAQSPPFTIHTFGFGYSLDSKLLFDLAAFGSGIFCYLPDCNLIGTTFVNCLANALSAAVNVSTIELAYEGVTNVKSIGYKMDNNRISVGTISYGQSRDFIVQFQLPPDKRFKITAKLRYLNQDDIQTIEAIQAPEPLRVFKQLSRAMYCELIGDALAKLGSGPVDLGFLATVRELLTTLPSKDEEEVKTLLRDVVSSDPMEGRVSKGFSTPERIKRWGQHYSRSIVRAHQLQQCHNFKDPGVQLYGGKLFKDIQHQADMIFCNLPPPTQSYALSAQNIAAALSAPPPDMSSYMDSGGGCFDGEGRVRLADGTFKAVRELQKQDLLLGPDPDPARVLCLVAFPIRRAIKMVHINGVWITPKHPVKQKGVWMRAQDCGPCEQHYCEYIYNLVLDKQHMVCVNDVCLITLAHGMHDNPVVEHPYYGTDLVLKDLQRVSGWSEGFVVMHKCRKLKHPLTGQVTQLLV